MILKLSKAYHMYRPATTLRLRERSSLNIHKMCGAAYYPQGDGSPPPSPLCPNGSARTNIPSRSQIRDGGFHAPRSSLSPTCLLPLLWATTFV